MVSSSISSWQIDGEKMETVTDFLGLQNHSRWWLQPWTLLTKVHIIKAMVFPVVMYGRESWTIKKAEPWRIDAFELWYSRRLFRIPWTTGRPNQLILKKINLEYSLEGLMLKLTHQYFVHQCRVDSLGKTLMMGKIEGWRRKGRGWDGWMALSP